MLLLVRSYKIYRVDLMLPENYEPKGGLVPNILHNHDDCKWADNANRSRNAFCVTRNMRSRLCFRGGHRFHNFKNRNYYQLSEIAAVLLALNCFCRHC
mmetsp:Transcript_7022/g.9741  ORF Transcript_7022/g.9741 Transcript_7022/m.9741 type:complete len:98 (+) Transcript_7022:262-555(+)